MKALLVIIMNLCLHVTYAQKPDTTKTFIQGKELGEVAPLGVITRQQNDLAPEHIWVELQVRVDLTLDVSPLSVELIVLRRLGRVEARSPVRDAGHVPPSVVRSTAELGYFSCGHRIGDHRQDSQDARGPASQSR